MASPSWLMHLQARARGEVAGYFDPNVPTEERGAQPTPLAPTPTGFLAHPDTVADSEDAGVDLVVNMPAGEDSTPPVVATTMGTDPRVGQLLDQVEILLRERGTTPEQVQGQTPVVDREVVEPAPAEPAPELVGTAHDETEYSAPAVPVDDAPPPAPEQ